MALCSGAAAAGACARRRLFPCATVDPSRCWLCQPAALGEQVVEDQLATAGVLRGLDDPPPGKPWGVTCEALSRCGVMQGQLEGMVTCDLWSRTGAKLGQLEGMVRLLLPPEHAGACGGGCRWRRRRQLPVLRLNASDTFMVRVGP